MKVRRITWIGFIVAIFAILSIGRVDPRISMAIGIIGMTISIIALATSRGGDE